MPKHHLRFDASGAANNASGAASDWEKICHARDVGAEPERFTLRDGTDIVVVRKQGKLMAMSNRCPHKDASLHRSGDIEDLGGDIGLALRCPKHQGKFGGGLFVSFGTGQCTTRKPCSKSDEVRDWKVPVYDSKEEENSIWVRPHREGHVEPPPAAEKAPERTAPAAAAPPPAPPRAERTEEEEPRFAADLVRATQVSHDSFVFSMQLLERADRAAFAHEPAVMWHVWLHLGDVSREYTPVSPLEHTARTGEMRMLIKLYPDGKMSQALARARAAERVYIGPPRVTLSVPALEGASAGAGAARGQTFNFLAGGTGIAPCLQLATRAREVCASVRLVYSEHLLLGTAGRGAAAMTIVSGPDGFNKHCDGLVCAVVPEAHPLVVLDA